MAQEDQPHDGYKILVRRQIGVRPQIVGDLPEPGFKFADEFEAVFGVGDFLGAILAIGTISKYRP
jgi:hypothetical protein